MAINFAQSVSRAPQLGAGSPWLMQGLESISQAVRDREAMRKNRAAEEDRDLQRETSERIAKMQTIDLANLRDEQRQAREQRLFEREDTKQAEARYHQFMKDYQDALSSGDTSRAQAILETQGGEFARTPPPQEPVPSPSTAPLPLAGRPSLSAPLGAPGGEVSMGEAMPQIGSIGLGSGLPTGIAQLPLASPTPAPTPPPPEAPEQVEFINPATGEVARLRSMDSVREGRTREIAKVLRASGMTDDAAIYEQASDLEALFPGGPKENFGQFLALLKVGLDQKNKRELLELKKRKASGRGRAAKDGGILVPTYRAVMGEGQDTVNTTLAVNGIRDVGKQKAASKYILQVLSDPNASVEEKQAAIIRIARGHDPRLSNKDVELWLNGVSVSQNLVGMWKRLVNREGGIDQMHIDNLTEAARGAYKDILTREVDALNALATSYKGADEYGKEAIAKHAYTVFSASDLKKKGILPPRGFKPSVGSGKNRTGKDVMVLRERGQSEASKKLQRALELAQ